MKSVMMDPADSRQSSNVFSPSGQYGQAHAQLAVGAHHMKLVATENELYEQEVACFIEGVKVGILHENEAYDYHQSIRTLDNHGMELLVPCRVTDNKVIYYRPVPRESLRKWVADQTVTTVTKVPVVAHEEMPEDVSEGGVGFETDAKQVSSRVSRHMLKLLSQDLFSPLDMPVAKRFVYGIYWHESKTVRRPLGVQQSNALILVTYALHRSSSEVVIYGETVSLNNRKSPVIVIDDVDMISTIVQSPQKSGLMAEAIMTGITPLPHADQLAC